MLISIQFCRNCHQTVLIGLLTAILFAGTALAQNEGFYIIFGNPDCSPIMAAPGMEIEIPVWGVTPVNDYYDSVTFMNIPLATDDSIISERLGGYFPPHHVGLWNDRHFDPPAPDQQPGRTNQSMIAFAFLSDPYHPENNFITFGDTILICTYRMRVADNAFADEDTVYPFHIGYQQPNGGLIWGMQGGIISVVPEATFSSLFYAPSLCNYLPGDVNSDGITNGIDVIFGANYLKYGGRPPFYTCDCPTIQSPFYSAGDVNRSCSYNGLDIVYLVNFLKGIGPAAVPCPYCPPSGRR